MRSVTGNSYVDIRVARQRGRRRPTLRPVRVAICFRSCMHYRVPVFRRLAREPDLAVKVFYGHDVPGTQLSSAKHIDGFDHQRLHTVISRVALGGRRGVLVLFPGLLWALRRFRPDVIVTSGGANVINNLFIYIYSWLHGVPVVWWTLGRIAGRSYPRWFSPYRALVKRMERSAVALLGYSSVALRYFQESGYGRSKAFVATNTVDTDAILTTRRFAIERSRTVRTNHGLGARRIVLYVGSLSPGKGVDRLIRAYGTIVDAVGDSRLLIVGDGPDRARLESLAADCVADGHVEFAGEVISGVDAYFEVGDLFVMPGLGGLAISEALAHGLPVICTVGDGCEVDLVKDGVTGYRMSAPHDDDESVVQFLAARMKGLLTDDQARSEMSRSVRQLISGEYSFDAYVQSVVSAIAYAHGKKGRGFRAALVRGAAS